MTAPPTHASTESPAAPLPLSYASADEFALIRPLLWLIIAIQASLVAGDVSRIGFRILIGVTSKQAAAMWSTDLGFFATSFIHMGLAAWVGLTAASALRSQRLGPTQVACGLYAVLTLAIGLILTVLNSAMVRQVTALQAFSAWPYIWSNVVGQFIMAIVPAATWLILGRVRRQWPNWR